ncbi:hypothetical protein KBK24_0119885 [Burkholderia sp. K24]|uniref:porin n=1 Tax=Paraburkholderia fungorum TaxID=134537 RepID=UPI0004ABAE91|nr:porin [Paraburkholderia fungorum]KFX63945.1 hypothetical protein KBK24_0119885 [Burkholderia sp. K24]MBU7436203.1 porin [Paraburkholderia fungorum]
MKSRIFLVLPFLVVPALCAAEGSMTLYGLIDNGLAYVSNQGGSHTWKAQSSNLSGDRWGLKGVEDLGGGLQALFQLENGFDVNSGAAAQGGREFGRQAYVGIRSNQYGAVTLGRQYESVLEYVGDLSSGSQWASLVGSHVANMDDLGAPAFRINNSVKYTSINIAGFKFGGLYGFSNQPGGFATNQALSLGARYTHDGLVLSAGYFRLNNPAASGTAGAVGSSGSGAGSDYGGATGLASLGGSGTIRRHQVLAAGGAYTVGPATVALLYSHTAFDASINSARADNYEINGKYQFTPALMLGVAYIYTNGHNDVGGHPKYQQVNLGVDYFLSKRTDLYLIGLYQHAMGGANAAALYSMQASSTNSQAAVIAGLRHSF